jgi:hypothetical protein
MALEASQHHQLNQQCGIPSGSQYVAQHIEASYEI